MLKGWRRKRRGIYPLLFHRRHSLDSTAPQATAPVEQPLPLLGSHQVPMTPLPLLVSLDLEDVQADRLRDLWGPVKTNLQSPLFKK